MNNDFTTKSAMGKTIKALADAESKEYKTTIRIAKKYRKVNAKYDKALGGGAQITIKNADKTGKLISELLLMDNIDFREVLRVTSKYRKAEKIRQKTIRLANKLDKDYGLRSMDGLKSLNYEQI